jgi:hypothetical protein
MFLIRYNTIRIVGFQYCESALKEINVELCAAILIRFVTPIILMK